MHAFLSSLQPVLRPVDAILTGQGVTFVVQEEREIGVTLSCYYDFLVQEERKTGVTVKYYYDFVVQEERNRCQF